MWRNFSSVSMYFKLLIILFQTLISILKPDFYHITLSLINTINIANPHSDTHSSNFVHSILNIFNSFILIFWLFHDISISQGFPLISSSTLNFYWCLYYLHYSLIKDLPNNILFCVGFISNFDREVNILEEGSLYNNLMKISMIL